jgi:hypothetical protein
MPARCRRAEAAARAPPPPRMRDPAAVSLPAISLSLTLRSVRVVGRVVGAVARLVGGAGDRRELSGLCSGASCAVYPVGKTGSRLGMYFGLVDSAGSGYVCWATLHWPLHCGK